MRVHPVLCLCGAVALLSGCVTAHPLPRDRSSVYVQTSDQGELPLLVTDQTVVVKDGQRVSAAQLKGGEDVRASYAVVDGKMRAMRIDATERPGEPRQDPAMMQVVPGDQSAPDDREPPVRSAPDDFELLPDTH